MSRNVFDFDGAAEKTFPSFEKFTKAFEDPYYINVMEPDERRFRDKSGVPQVATQATSTMGVVREIVVGGRAVVDLSEEVMEGWREWRREGRGSGIRKREGRGGWNFVSHTEPVVRGGLPKGDLIFKDL